MSCSSSRAGARSENAETNFAPPPSPAVSRDEVITGHQFLQQPANLVGMARRGPTVKLRSELRLGFNQRVCRWATRDKDLVVSCTLMLFVGGKQILVQLLARPQA